MRELRLLDPDGYTVPGAVMDVTDDEAPGAEQLLLTVYAPVDADREGQDVRHYRVQSTPTDA